MRTYLSALFATIALTTFAADPSGGPSQSSDSKNPNGGEVAIGRAKKENLLPWPEPEIAAVQKLEKELKADLPAESFSFRRLGPWVIATDLPADEAKLFIDGTMARGGAAIQRQLFTKTARTEPVKVYLFKNHDSYTLYNKKLFGEHPTTPYGYYSRHKKALVMNIGTGGGTLLHEMVHAMAEADFEEIPSWLNEGLGSLYEASMTDRAGKVRGVTNWRLRGLLKDLDAGTATKFSDLVAMDTNTFYGERSGSNYAASRYLMQYLQEKGKLETFYTRIRDKKDKDAAASLKFCFDDKLSVEEIEKQVYAWVKTLVAPK
ncbi:MAG TPA: hypothetical protein VEJ63_10740 [Planctomycetota bacterium]|nr:hypothetical protein [Planctomycetota bacterium]